MKARIRVVEVEVRALSRQIAKQIPLRYERTGKEEWFGWINYDAIASGSPKAYLGLLDGELVLVRASAFFPNPEPSVPQIYLV